MSAAEYVTFDTNVGQFTVELYTKHAPKASHYHHNIMPVLTLRHVITSASSQSGVIITVLYSTG
jgi:cyclophilin family peptidyl-prolyl cis-trans isomerase